MDERADEIIRNKIQLNYCDNKTNKYLRRYENLLHYRRLRPPRGFGLLLWPSSGKCFSKDMLQRTPKLIYKYEGESKSKGKIHLTTVIEVTVSNFTYHFST